MPSAVEIAKNVVKENPDCFNDDIRTVAIIAGAMLYFKTKIDEYLNDSVDFSELNKLTSKTKNQ